MNGWVDDEWIDGWRDGWKDKWTNYLKRICLPCRRPWFNSWVGKIHWKRDRLPTPVFLGFTGAQTVKNPPAVWETWVQSLGWEDPLEECRATHSSILAWRIPMDRVAWRATVHGVAKSRTWLSNFHFFHILYSIDRFSINIWNTSDDDYNSNAYYFCTLCWALSQLLCINFLI